MAYDLDKPLIKWGEAHSYDLRTAYANTGIFAATGGGKTSGAGAFIRKAFLEKGPGRPVPEGMGGIIITAKAGDVYDWIKDIKLADRWEDTYIFGGPEGKRDACFNYLGWNPGGRVVSNVLNRQLLLSEVSVTAERSRGNTSAGQGGGDSAYFQTQLATLLTWLLLLVQTARIPLSIATLSTILNSAPVNRAALNSKEWQKGGMGQVLAMLAREYTQEGDPERRADINNLFAFFTERWPDLNSRPRSITEGMADATFSLMMQAPLRGLFTGANSTITPEAVFKGKLILVDARVLQDPALGGIMAQIWKYCYQLAVKQRSGKTEELRPAWFYCDEYQTIASPLDADFFAISRGLAAPNCVLCQQRESLTRVLGQETADNLLSNIQTKIWGQNSGPTNQWASDLIGSRYIKVDTLSMGGGATHSPLGDPHGHSGNTGISRRDELRPYVLASEFLTLRTGGPGFNNFEVDTIVFSGGKTFAGDNGERVPFKRLTFRQRKD